MTVATEPESPQTKSTATGRMKALVYHGPGKRAWEETPRPAIQNATDAIVRITTSTICGTDLHILKGDLPSVTPGRILGHEGIGVVTEVGTAVTAVRPGDRVIISCVTACGKCDYCRKGMYSHCRDGGWILGNTIDGTQAEFVRIPHADMSLYHVPAGGDEEALVMLSDILPTGFECGVLNGQVKPGDTVAIVGAGPIGLAVLLTAQFYSPAAVLMIDLDDNRLRVAQGLRRDDPDQQRRRQGGRARAGVDRRRAAWTWRSKRWACPRRSTSASPSSRPADTSPMWASTANRWSCMSRSSGIATSR